MKTAHGPMVWRIGDLALTGFLCASLCLPVSGESGEKSDADLAASFVRTAFEDLGAVPGECPAVIARVVAPDQAVACAVFDPGEEPFKKAWRRGTRGARRSARPAPGSAWQHDRGVYEKRFYIGYVPLQVLFDENSSVLAIVHSTIRPCDEEWKPAIETWSEVCATDPGSSSTGDGRVCPEKIEGANPDFPAEVFRRHGSGEVRLGARVGADGAIKEICLLDADPADPEIILITIETIRQWRYRPAGQNGMPVESRLEVRTHFETY